MRADLVLTAVALIVLTSGSARAASFAVDDLADAVDASPGNGVCATARGSCTLRAAIQETNALAGADQVTLAVGIHELSIAGTDEDEAATGDLDITDDLTIAGANAYLSVIDANGIDGVLEQALSLGFPQVLVLRDLTITGGDRDIDSGGGLRHSHVVDAERIIVTGNVAGTGGGIASGVGSPTLGLRYSIVSLNEALWDGGGIDATDVTEFLVEQSIIIGNTVAAKLASGGGGLRYQGYDDVGRINEVIIYGNNIDGDSTNVSGGGVAVRDSGRLIVEQSWIGHNLVGTWGAATAEGEGGGLSFEGVSQEHIIANTTIEGNLADRGGALAASIDVSITHATIAATARKSAAERCSTTAMGTKCG